MDTRSPAYSFGGFVVNFCVATDGHCDIGDLLLCVVIPFGNFEGGELCLYELGLVIDLAPLTAFIFPSSDVTHFNLHFQGTRGSLVLHSDRQGKTWIVDRNGWSHIKKKCYTV